MLGEKHFLVVVIAEKGLVAGIAQMACLDHVAHELDRRVALLAVAFTLGLDHNLAEVDAAGLELEVELDGLSFQREGDLLGVIADERYLQCAVAVRHIKGELPVEISGAAKSRSFPK